MTSNMALAQTDEKKKHQIHVSQEISHQKIQQKNLSSGIYLLALDNIFMLFRNFGVEIHVGMNHFNRSLRRTLTQYQVKSLHVYARGRRAKQIYKGS